MENDHVIEILLAEDSPADVRLTQEALKESNIRTNLSVVNDGLEVMAFLHKRDNFADAPTPDVILLDLNMPRMGGREVLAEMQQHDELKVVPVVVLTNSSEDSDVLDTYSLCANSYIRKPVDINDFFDVIRSIENYWFQTVTLPKIARN
jgi:two-component system, chemotaxis family, response regulator Rcp1